MQPTLEPTKKSHRILVLILVILLTAGVIGGSTYYVLNQQIKKQDKLIEELQKKETASNAATQKEEEKKAEAPAVKDETDNANSKTEIEEVKEFCGLASYDDDTKYVALAENKYGKFARCIITYGIEGTSVTVGKKVDNKWMKIKEGYSELTKAQIDQNHLPPSIYINYPSQ